jgi:5'-methylthioadenosine phosphorylase
MAMVTDYDCWRAGHDDVTVDQIVAVMHQNATNAAEVLRAAVGAVPAERTCACASAIEHAILTSRDAIPAATRARLEPIIGKYV